MVREKLILSDKIEILLLSTDDILQKLSMFCKHAWIYTYFYWSYAIYWENKATYWSFMMSEINLVLWLKSSCAENECVLTISLWMQSL
jgi:hypothetical protein